MESEDSDCFFCSTIVKLYQKSKKLQKENPDFYQRQIQEEEQRNHHLRVVHEILQQQIDIRKHVLLKLAQVHCCSVWQPKN